MFFTEIYFRFHILQFYTPTARQGGGRDLHVNKYIFFCAESPGGSRPATCRPSTGRQAARPPGKGAAGSPPNIKAEPLPSHPHFLPTRSREGRGRERRGEGGNSTGEALPDFGSKPQVTNISQLCHSRIFVCLIL